MFRTGKHFKDNQKSRASDPQPPEPDSPAIDQPDSAQAYDKPPQHPSSMDRDTPEIESLVRDIRNGSLSAFLSKGAELTGQMSFKGILRVDGHLTGTVSSEDGTLILSAGAQVDANIEVTAANIQGTVNGNITAPKRIEIGPVAKVIGDIQTAQLVIEDGAIFEGYCRMSSETASEQATQGEENMKAFGASAGD